MNFDKGAFEKTVLLSALKSPDDMMPDELLKEFLRKFGRQDVCKSLDHLYAMGLIEESTLEGADGHPHCWAPVITCSGKKAAERLQDD